MSSGYGDKDKLELARALASSFKGGGGNKGSRGKDNFSAYRTGPRRDRFIPEKDFSFSRSGHQRDPHEHRGQKGNTKRYQENGAPPITQRNYSNAGTFTPNASGANTQSALLGGSGMAFLRREDQRAEQSAQRPKVQVSELPPVPMQRPQPVLAEREKAPVAKTQTGAAPTSFGIMDLIRSHAPPSMASQAGFGTRGTVGSHVREESDRPKAATADVNAPYNVSQLAQTLPAAIPSQQLNSSGETFKSANESGFPGLSASRFATEPNSTECGATTLSDRPSTVRRPAKGLGASKWA